MDGTGFPNNDKRAQDLLGECKPGRGFAQRGDAGVAASEAPEPACWALLAPSRDAVLVWNVAGRVVYANPAAGRLWLTAAEALRGRDVATLIPADAMASEGANPLLDVTDHVLAIEGQRPRRARISTAAVHVAGVPHTIAYIQDIAQERESRDLLAQTLEQLDDAVLMVEADGRIARLNAAAERLWGQPREALADEDIAVLLPGGLPKADGTVHEAVFSNASGRTCRADLSVATVFLDDRILYAVVVRAAASGPVESPKPVVSPEPAASSPTVAPPTADLLEWRPEAILGEVRRREFARLAPAWHGVQTVRPARAPHAPIKADITQCTIAAADCGVPSSASLLGLLR